MEIRFTIPICPRTKKNSQSIRINKHTGRPFVSTSDAYKEYRAAALMLIPAGVRKHIGERVNLKCVYYMQTRRRVDLNNLLEATADVLVDAGVLEDDNCDIVAGHDGSRVRYSKDRPRTEITITSMEDEADV